jgi:hypothetical protein
MERRRVRKLFADLPLGEGVGMYGFRRYFASNALGNGIPITDVAEWMGHKSIEETYRTYRHLMPGSITKARPDPGRRPLGSSLISGFEGTAGSSSAGGTAGGPR